MNEGPYINKYEANKIAGEDHLGIRYVSVIISDKLQHGITSVTPHARYWSFYSWVLYDFIKNETNKTMENFKKYLKKQEWFYILANIAVAEKYEEGISGLIGVSKGRKIWNENINPIPVYFDYVKNSRGGYGTAYSNVLKILGLTRESNAEIGVEIDRLTEKGKKLAELFEIEIQNTKYYKNRFNNKFSRNELLEYGNKAGLTMLSSKSKETEYLTELFMPQKSKLISSKRRKNSLNYYKYIVRNNDNNISRNKWRNIMYDDIFNNEIPEKIKEVVIGWEIYQGRQLFTYSLESIWSYILEVIARNIYSYKNLIKNVINNLKLEKINLSSKNDELLKLLPLNKKTREQYINDMKRKGIDIRKKVYNALLVMLDVYHRFNNRSDFNDFHNNLYKEGGIDHISLKIWEKTVSSYKNKSIKELLNYVIKKYILIQHQKVALNKLISTNNNTFHFLEDEGRLFFVSDDRPAFNAFRVNQGISILKDLKLI